MNKADLVAKVADKTGFKKKDAEMALDAVLETIEEALVAGDSVRLIGFGTFETRSRKARTGRNPQKPDKVISIPASKAPVFKAPQKPDKVISIPASKAPVFKAGKSLKDAVNK